MDYTLARHNMIQCQIRPWDVLDERVLELLARVPREDFVPAAYRNLAFADMQIPLAHGQVMMAPKLEARLLQALEIRPQDRILEIGTGSGHLTALLAALGAQVVSVEMFPDLLEGARERLATHGVSNVVLELGDGAHGWERHAPYDAILLTGSVASLPQALTRQLAVGGRLAAVVGAPPVMEAVLVRRVSEISWSHTGLFETSLPPLANAEPPRKFVF